MIRLIDVLWLDRSARTVAAAFEVEHTTSIYSGIVRLLDLALGAPASATQGPSTRSRSCSEAAANPRSAQTVARFNRSAFVITDTELKLIAAAAIIGLSSQPNTG